MQYHKRFYLWLFLEMLVLPYLIDYYLRHMDYKSLKIFKNPMFSHDALVELFYCQVTAYHKQFFKRDLCQKW